MPSRSVARATSLPTCPSPGRSSIPRRSSRAIPTSFSPPRPPARGLPGSRTGSASLASPRYAIIASLPSRTRRSAASGRASSTPPKNYVGRLRGSVAEVRELQRHVELCAAQQRNRRLQVIALLAADAYFIALDARLDLELRVLHQPRDVAAGVGIDAVAQHHFLLRGRERGLRLLDLQAGKIDAALGEPQLENLEHLPKLKIHLRLQRHGEVLELEARAGVLEIEALRELAVRLVDGVGDLVGIELGHGIEGWHAFTSRRAAAAASSLCAACAPGGVGVAGSARARDGGGVRAP